MCITREKRLQLKKKRVFNRILSERWKRGKPNPAWKDGIQASMWKKDMADEGRIDRKLWKMKTVLRIEDISGYTGKTL